MHSNNVPNERKTAPSLNMHFASSSSWSTPLGSPVGGDDFPDPAREKSSLSPSLLPLLSPSDDFFAFFSLFRHHHHASPPRSTLPPHINNVLSLLSLSRPGHACPLWPGSWTTWAWACQCACRTPGSPGCPSPPPSRLGQPGSWSAPRHGRGPGQKNEE